MATTINADTSSGLILTSDTSGIVQIQNAGTTKLTVNSSGATVAGTLAATAVTGDGSALTGISSGGLTEITDFATTSGTTVTSPTLNLSTYKLIYLVCNKIGTATDSGPGLKLTPNGGSIVDFAGGFGATVNLYGGWWIDLANGVGMGAINIGTAAAATVAAYNGSRTFVNTGISTSTTSIAFTTADGATFNLGNIKIYGLK